MFATNRELPKPCCPGSLHLYIINNNNNNNSDSTTLRPKLEDETQRTQRQGPQSRVSHINYSCYNYGFINLPKVIKLKLVMRKRLSHCSLGKPPSILRLHSN